MKVNIKMMIMIVFARLLYGCFHSTKAEFVEYINKELADYDEFIEEASDTEDNFIQAMETQQPNETIAILTKDFIPVVENTLYKLEAFEAESEEITDLNNLLVGRTSALNDHLHTQLVVFHLFMDMETEEDLLDAITALDHVIDHIKESIDYDEELRSTVDELVAKYDLDVDG